MKILFIYTRSTKGAHVFSECNEKMQEVPFGQYKVGTLYIRKTAMPQVVETISVEIKPHSLVGEAE